MSDVVLTISTGEVEGDLTSRVEEFEVAFLTDVRDRFLDNVHVDTGAMRESASLITPHGSDYAEHVAAAAALNPAASFAPEAAVGPQEAILQVPINYAAHEEFGTVRRAAHPALVPAIESAAANADAIAQRVFGL